MILDGHNVRETQSTPRAIDSVRMSTFQSTVETNAAYMTSDISVRMSTFGPLFSTGQKLTQHIGLDPTH